MSEGLGQEKQNLQGFKTVIIGPGAIGTLFAALLSRGGHDITLLDHKSERAAERNANGITIVNRDNSWHTQLNSTANSQSIGKANLVFICTKAYDTKNAIKHLPSITDENTIVVSLQNGIGNAEQILKYAPQHTLCATTAMAAYITTPQSIIHWTGKGITQLAPFKSTSTGDTEIVERLLSTINCQCIVLNNALNMLWGKLIINAAINPVTAIHNITNGMLLESAEAREQAFAAAIEAKSVADALNIELPYSDTVAAITETCKTTASNHSSMLQDIKNKRRTEIDSITGAIIAEADRLNIPVPTNKHLYKSLSKLK